MRPLTTSLLVAAGLLALSGCATRAAGPGASAALAPTAGNSVSGNLRFADASGGVRVTGELRGLKPNAEQGFHVHEKGDCSAPDATSAGGHFNPTGQPHGQPGGAAHHAGDMPNLRADANGVARVDATISGLTVAAGPNSVIDRAVVVHRDRDDYKSQPAGNSGARVACGVVHKA